MKVCTKCNIEKEEYQFSFRTDTQKYRNQCTMCTKGYNSNIKKRAIEKDNLFKSGKKKCSNCLKEKLNEEFSKDRQTTTGLCSRCKECVNKINIENKEIRKKSTAKNRYNITGEKYDELMSINNCQICKEKFTEELYRCIDHCHDTLKVRGVLCFYCNAGIGHLRDNVIILKNAIEYLKK